MSSITAIAAPAPAPGPRPRRRRPPQDVRDEALRRNAVAVASRAAFGPDHAAVVLTVEHLEGQRDRRTARKKALYLLEFLDWCHATGRDPFRVRRVEARIYYASLPSGYARATKHVRMSTLRSWYVDAQEANLCPHNPFYRVGPKNIDPRIPTPYITLEQVDRVVGVQQERLASGSASPVDYRNAVLFYVMTRVGPRRFEAAQARWRDIETVGDVVRWAIHGKGDEDLRTTLPPDVIETLDAWRRKLASIIGREVRPDDAIFPVLGRGAAAIAAYAASGPLEGAAVGTVGNLYKAALADAGITGPRMCAHTARATAATLAHRSGAPDREIQRMLRHRLLATTHRYIKLLEDTTSPAEAWQPARMDFGAAAAAERARAAAAAGPARRRRTRRAPGAQAGAGR